MTNIIITTRQRDGRDVQHIFRLRSHQINYPPRPSSPYEMQRFSGDLQIQLDWNSQAQNYFDEWFNIGNTAYNGDGYLFVGLKRKIELLTDDESTNHMFFHECFITRIESLNNENGINVINVTIRYDYYSLPNPPTVVTNYSTANNNQVVHLNGNEVICGERHFSNTIVDAINDRTSDVMTAYWSNSNVVHSYNPTITAPRSLASLNGLLSGYQENVTESFKNMLNNLIDNLETL